MYQLLVKEPEADNGEEVRREASLELLRLVLGMYKFREGWLQEKVKKYRARAADEFQLELYEGQLKHLRALDDVAALQSAVSEGGSGVSDKIVGTAMLLVGKLRRHVWDQNTTWAMEKSKTVGRTYDLTKDLLSDRIFADQLGLLIVVGAHGDDDNGQSYSGSAYIFVRDALGSWSEQAKLTASTPVAADYFGRTVSISGDTAIVSAHGRDDVASSAGAAYIFVRNDDDSWSEQAKLTASDAAASDSFGISVSVSGDTAIVGAHQNDDGGVSTGSAYIFVRGTDDSWSEQAKLTASDPAWWDYFGQSVSISGDMAIVGAYGDDDGASKAGSAYVFARDGDTWSEQA
jgi:hypothetical protein